VVTYAPVLIEPPAVTPLPYGLLTAAQIIQHGQESRFGMGVQYQPDYCGEATDTAGVCEDLGTLSASVTDLTVEFDAAGNPDGRYIVLWGDDSDPETIARLDLAGHLYDAPGDYDVIVTGPHSYRAVVTITVDDTDPSGPFEAAVGLSKIPTEGMDTVEAEAFAIMHMFRCKAPGSIQLGEERARRSLQLGEGRAVERVLAARMARDEDTVILNDQAVHPIDGLAQLEKYAAAHYPGVPMVHMTRDVGTILTALGAVGRYGDHLETVQGARVASGGGYSPLRHPVPTSENTTGTALPDNAMGQEWLYVTGHVQVHRSESIDVRPTFSTSPADNQFVALSERLYAVTYECIVAAIAVSTSYLVPAVAA
jgi:hypothetical protein